MPQLNNKTILVIDDEKPFVELIREVLEERGFEVVAAYNGEEALQKLNQIKPDLILLDIKMPKMGGLQFYDRICLPNCQPMYPIIVVTASENLQELFTNLPVEGFFSKPVKIEMLLTKINDIFQRKEREKNQSLIKKPVMQVRRILIVDDKMENLQKLSFLFLNAGYMVGVAQNATEAITRILDSDLPNVILMRHGLPGNPEYTVSYHLRGMSQGRNVEVVVYADDLKKLDPLSEKEIIQFVGAKNLVDLLDLDFIKNRCELLIKKHAELAA